MDLCRIWQAKRNNRSVGLIVNWQRRNRQNIRVRVYLIAGKSRSQGKIFLGRL